MRRWLGIIVVVMFILAAFSDDAGAALIQAGVALALLGLVLGLVTHRLFWLFGAGVGLMLLAGLANLWQVPISLALMVGTVCALIFLAVVRPRPRPRRH